jgi:3-oxoacyl-[acyl-carrier protein] reductase
VLALGFGPNNIQVNAVAPGSIRTLGIIQQIQQNHKIPENKLEAFFKGLAAQLPLRRMGEPDDIARAVFFLASNASDYMTGNVLLVNGGRLVS